MPEPDRTTLLAPGVPDQQMLAVQALDPSAHVDYSHWTHRWYVSARIEIGNGTFLTGITEHRDTPLEALDAFWERITHLADGEYLVTSYRGYRREWTWNGGAFTEATRDEVFDAQQRASEVRTVTQPKADGS